MLHCSLQSSSNDYESQWNSITKCTIITVSLVKSLFLWLLINKILFTLKNHFYFSDSFTKVCLKVPLKSLFCLIKILWLQITLKQFSLKSLFLEWLINLLINVCSNVLQNHISLMMESSNRVNGPFRNCQSWSFITVHDQFKSSRLRLYCQVTIWPRKHKRKTPSQAFTRSKQIYRFGRSLKFCGTVHSA